MSGILTEWISWQAAFYFYGTMGIIWYGFWLWLTFEKPRNHPTITLQELKYIEKSLGDSVQLAMPKISTTPWHQMFRSMPVYAIIVANFCRSWNFYLLVLYQSAYLKHVFKFDIAKVTSKMIWLHIFLISELFVTGWYSRSTSSFINDHNCTVWWNVGRSLAEKWNLKYNNGQKDLQLWWLWYGRTLLFCCGTL